MVKEDSVTCESFTIISIDSLLFYENKYHLQIYLDNFAYKIVDKQMTDLFDSDNNKLFDVVKWFLSIMYNNSIDLGERIDVAKSNNSKECINCYYRYFNCRSKFQKSVCNACHDLLMLCLNISDITIITIKSSDYRCIIHDISKSDTIPSLKNFGLDDRGYT